ncbi:hypothetical protein LRC39_21950 [Rhodopseudomonas sp. P1]|uniref:hypothetical protein n=1 Tax=Rhodopseudomonas sp. P1 TaxID=3434357 RepID=UPI0031FC2FC7
MFEKILYVILGWLLGLLGPIVTDQIKSLLRRREFVSALKVELEDLQFRLAISSLSLLQSHGTLDKDFATWALRIASRYSGSEPSSNIVRFLEGFVSASDETVRNLNEHARAADGVGASLKSFQVSFLENNIPEIQKLNPAVQRKLYEFRNQLSIINRDVARSDDYLMLTFNSSLTSDNHKRITDDLGRLYQQVQRRTKDAADRIGSILPDLK